MSDLEEFFAKPEIRLSMATLWTRLCNQADAENRDVAEIMQEMVDDDPQRAKTFALLEAWLQQQD